MVSLCQRLIRAGLPDRYIGNPWLDQVLMAAVYACLLILFMRAVPLGRHLQSARRHMLAAAYALLLYRRIPRMVMRAEATLVCYNLKYLLYLTPTILFGGALFASALDPLAERYGSQPVKVGQDLVISATGTGDIQVTDEDFALEARVRVPKLKTTWAKLRAKHAGVLLIQVGAHVATVNVDTPDVPRVAWRYWDDLAVHVTYPAGGHGWAVCFLGTSVVLMWLVGVQL